MTRVEVVPVPTELRTPTQKPQLQAGTTADIGRLIVAYEAVLDDNISKIVAIDQILTEAEKEAAKLRQSSAE